MEARASPQVDLAEWGREEFPRRVDSEECVPERDHLLDSMAAVRAFPGETVARREDFSGLYRKMSRIR